MLDDLLGNWSVDHTTLRIELDALRTVVTSTLAVRRNVAAPLDAPLVLDGKGLELQFISINDRVLNESDFVKSDVSLELSLDGLRAAEVTCVVVVAAGGPTQQGLTARSNMLSTNCEPEGMRRITYCLDRPSARSTYSVTLVADPASFPVLLSNGDCTGEGTLDDGRHWASFDDPIPKPTYLFALVAGTLEHRSTTHTTNDGRRINLEVWAAPELIGGSAYALELMPEVMAWDEAQGGIAHDLDTLRFVAIPGYPDATEYHGLMFFEPTTLLTDPSGYTDDDLVPIFANVSHEYLHQVRGNRVTVADWHQLALKEGLTVLGQHDFREECYGASGRIQFVIDLRRLQFPEEITVGAAVLQSDVTDPAQMYTRTTYFKGAEIFRMLRSVVGNAVWREAFVAFIARFDLRSAEVFDFVTELRVAAPHKAENIDGIARWFSLIGRPVVAARIDRNTEGQVTVILERTDVLGDDPAVFIPVDVAFFGTDGAAIEVCELGATHSSHVHQLLLTARSQRFTFQSESTSIPSLLRGYTAPIDLSTDHTDEQLAVIVRSESDAVARWMASEELMIRGINAIRRGDVTTSAAVVDLLTSSLGAVLTNPAEDPAIVAHLLASPDEYALGDREAMIDVDGVHNGLLNFRRQLAAAMVTQLGEAFERNSNDVADSWLALDIAKRSLTDVCLGLLLDTGNPSEIKRAIRRIDSPNKTAAVRALIQLVHHDGEVVDAALERTRERWNDSPRMLERWMRAQSGSRSSQTIQRLRAIVNSDLYVRTNRSRVMAVWFPFCTRNRSQFHNLSGQGYTVFVDEAAELFQVNPGLVLRLVGDLLQFHRFDDARQTLMRNELVRMQTMPGLPQFAVDRLDQLLAE